MKGRPLDSVTLANDAFASDALRVCLALGGWGLGTGGSPMGGGGGGPPMGGGGGMADPDKFAGAEKPVGRLGPGEGRDRENVESSFSGKGGATRAAEDGSFSGSGGTSFSFSGRGGGPLVVSCLSFSGSDGIFGLN